MVIAVPTVPPNHPAAGVAIETVTPLKLADESTACHSDSPCCTAAFSWLAVKAFDGSTGVAGALASIIGSMPFEVSGWVAIAPTPPATPKVAKVVIAISD